MNLFERQVKSGNKLIVSNFFYRNQYGFELPIEFESVTIEHNLVDGIVKVSGANKQLTYEERQEEIETMMSYLSDGSRIVCNGYTSLFGKQLEDYTQKELYDVLKMNAEGK